MNSWSKSDLGLDSDNRHLIDSSSTKPSKRLRICLINPRFEPSYWGFDYALPLYPGRVKCTMVTGELPHLASLTPNHEGYILDENVETIDFAFLERFDVVGVTGMNVQKYRMREILLELRERKIFIA